MKEIFSEYGQAGMSSNKERHKGFIQMWMYNGSNSYPSIAMTGEQIDIATTLLKDCALPISLRREEYNQHGVLVGPYNAAIYLMNGTTVILNELEKPEVSNARVGMNIKADLPEKTLTIISSTIPSLVKTANNLYLPLDEELIRLKLEYLKV